MADQLQDLLLSLKKLPSEVREETVTHIAALIEEMMRDTSKEPARVNVPSRQEQLPWQDPFGAWSDLPDTMLDELDQK